MVRYKKKKFILKWLFLIISMIFLTCLQTMVFNRLEILGVFPLFLPCAVAVTANLTGISTGAVFGLCAGLFFDLITPGAPGVYAICFALCGIFIGILSKNFIRRSLGGGILCSVISLSLLDLIQVLYHTFFKSAPFLTACKIACTEIVYSSLFSPLIYLLFSVIINRYHNQDD